MPKLARLVSLLSIFILALFVAFNLPARAVAVSLEEVSSGTNAADAANYTIPTVTVSHDARLVLFVTSGRTDGTAAKASTVDGFSSTWHEVQSGVVNSGNLYSSVYTAQVDPGSSTVGVSFPAVQQNFSWRLVATASKADSIVQSVSTYSSSTSPAASLPAAVTAGNATLGFIAALSTSQTIAAGSGYSQIGTQYTNTTPTIRGAAEWRADGTKTVNFTASGTTQKTIIALEIAADGNVVTPPDGSKEAHVAVIGDSLTYQNGLGEANITQKLVDDGYSASNLYVYGVGGKKITAADSKGKTTVQNIADARTKLGNVDIWLIALGTNNVSDSQTTFVNNMNTVLNTIGSTDKVVWVGVGFYRVTNANAAKVNPLIQSTVGGYGNAAYADWNSYIHNGRDETGLWIYPTDSTHMTDAGYAIRNGYYLQQINAVDATLARP